MKPASVAGSSFAIAIARRRFNELEYRTLRRSDAREICHEM
jgi:hypothetical protein